MRTHFAVALVAIFSLSLAVGCADGRAGKRAAINASKLAKSSTQDDLTSVVPSDEDLEDSKDLNVEQEQPAPTETEKSVDDVIKKFNGLKIAGQAVDFNSLKDVTLELQEVGLLYTQNQSDLTDLSMAAFAHYKVQKVENSFTFTPVSDSEVVGANTNITLLGLPVLNHVAIAADGSTPNLEKSSELVLFPRVQDRQMSLISDSEEAKKLAVLEPVFDQIFNLTKDGDFGLSANTGAKIFTEILRTDDALSMLIEARIGETKVQTFLLKFKTSSSTEEQK